jgi:hypothetical protein
VEELELIRETAKDFGALGVTELSFTVCELLEWKRPTGGLKNLECRQFLESLSAQGLLSLPALRNTKKRGPQVVHQTARSDEQAPIGGSAGQYEPLRFELLRGDAGGNSALFRDYLQRYHYQGYKVPFGAHLRYLVRSEQCPEQVLACLLWTSPAWKLAERDRWIGWSPEVRARNLQFIVNHGRFLILPWVRVKGLASKILGHCARVIPSDWETVYGIRPLLLETLVEPERFRGTCYQAANWIRLGMTAGRGRMDRYNEVLGTPKELYVYPLCRKVQQRLIDAVPAVYRDSEEESPSRESEPECPPLPKEPPKVAHTPLRPPLRQPGATNTFGA